MVVYTTTRCPVTWNIADSALTKITQNNTQTANLPSSSSWLRENKNTSDSEEDELPPPFPCGYSRDHKANTTARNRTRRSKAQSRPGQGSVLKNRGTRSSVP